MLFIVINPLSTTEDTDLIFLSVKLCVLCGELNSKAVPKPFNIDYLLFSNYAGVR